MREIYLDNAATSKITDGINDTVCFFNNTLFYNPSAMYAPAIRAAEAVENARAVILRHLNSNGSLIFTSSATEANNWVVEKGLKRARASIVITEAEHPSIYVPCMRLKARGVDVRVAKLTGDGTVDEDDFVGKIDQNTALVSVVHVCAQTGAKNNLKRLSFLAKKISPDLIFHSDGVQAILKTQTDLVDLNVDCYTGSAHKIGAIRGAGFLCIRNGLNIEAFLRGGNQEKGLRAGTLNTAAIAAFARAFEENPYADTARFLALRDAVYDGLNAIENTVIFGNKNTNSPFITSAGISGVRAEILQNVLSSRGVYIGIGSACSPKTKTDRTLESMGIEKKLIEGAIRISLGWQNTLDEVREAMQIIASAVSQVGVS